MYLTNILTIFKNRKEYLVVWGRKSLGFSSCSVCKEGFLTMEIYQLVPLCRAASKQMQSSSANPWQNRCLSCNSSALQQLFVDTGANYSHPSHGRWFSYSANGRNIFSWERKIKKSEDGVEEVCWSNSEVRSVPWPQAVEPAGEQGKPGQFSERKINVLKKSQKSWLFSVHQQIVFTKKSKKKTLKMVF